MWVEPEFLQPHPLLHAANSSEVEALISSAQRPVPQDPGDHNQREALPNLEKWVELVHMAVEGSHSHQGGALHPGGHRDTNIVLGSSPYRPQGGWQDWWALQDLEGTPS